jgi:hypothetical protein
VERHPTARLLVVGDGSSSRSLKVLASRLRIRDSVVFTGRRDDVAAITAELAVAVLPSVREAQGISILEAMAQRVAVIATDVGGIPEVITSEKDGLLVAPEDPVALAAAIDRLLSDEPLRQRLAGAGYRTVEERYSLDAQVRRIEAVYDEDGQLRTSTFMDYLLPTIYEVPMTEKRALCTPSKHDGSGPGQVKGVTQIGGQGHPPSKYEGARNGRFFHSISARRYILQRYKFVI